MGDGRQGDEWVDAWSRLNSALEHAKEHMTKDEIMETVDEQLTVESNPRPVVPRRSKKTKSQ